MLQLDKISTEDREILDLEGLGFSCMKVLGKYNYRQMKESLGMHKHEDMIEICFLEKGFQYYNIQGEYYELKGGDILLTFPGEEHGTKSYPEDKGRLFWLIINITKGSQRLLNLTKKETDAIISRLMKLKPNRVFRASQLIKNDLNKIFRIYHSEETVYKKIQITNSLLNFLLNVIEYGEKSSAMEPSEEIQGICRYIDQNLDDTLRLEMLADKIHLSLSHFKFRFKKEIGIPPTDYILRRKMEHAKKILPQSSSVSDLAYSLAFSSPSYFATVFKRYTGKSPSEYMKHTIPYQNQLPGKNSEASIHARLKR